MEISKITLRQEDKTYTTIFADYADISQPQGSLLIIHDLAEHHDRYRELVAFWNSKGYDCFRYDLRGHGKDIRFEELGHFADEDGYRIVVQDAVHILEYIKKVNRGKKVVLYGQGIGAMIAQCALQESDFVDACVCSAPTVPTQYPVNRQLFIADLVRTIKKPRHYSPYLSRKITGYKEFRKISNRTAFDWLSRDNQLVGTYINDPLCGFTCTSASYCDYLQLIIQATTKGQMKRIRADLPLLFVAGSHDPAGNFGEGVADLFDSYQRLHFTRVDCIIYDEARHELIHETNREEVMKDVAEWLNKVLNNRNLTPVVSLSNRSKQEKAAEKAAEKAGKKKNGKKAIPAADAEYVSNSAALAGDAEDDDFNDLGYFERNPKKEK